ncbi:MAG: hypothetical protein ABI793_14880 [Flavobacterium sp.]
MGRILGLDLGDNSIGWAIVDTDQNKIVNCGVKIFHTSQISKRKFRKQTIELSKTRFKAIDFLLQNFKTTPYLFGLTFLTILTFTLTIINRQNWQFWLNIGLTALFTTLTIFHQDKNKK